MEIESTSNGVHQWNTFYHILIEPAIVWFTFLYNSTNILILLEIIGDCTKSEIPQQVDWPTIVWGMMTKMKRKEKNRSKEEVHRSLINLDWWEECNDQGLMYILSTKKVQSSICLMDFFSLHSHIILENLISGYNESTTTKKVKKKGSLM
jgi:hypothetical protein